MEYKYFVKENRRPNYDIDIWCNDMFGVPRLGRWRVNAAGYYFAHEDDYLVFRLTWPELFAQSVC